MNQEIIWKHKNGIDEITTNPAGNTISGLLAHKKYFSIEKGMEFDNNLLLSLAKDTDYLRKPNEEMKKYEDALRKHIKGAN